MSIRFSDLQMWNDTMIPQPCADSRRWLVLGVGDRRPFGSCPASHFLDRSEVMIRQPFFIMRDATVQLCCCVFDKAWPTDPIGSSQEQRLHATIAILGSVSSAQNVSRASWKLLEEDVTTYQERLGSYLKKMLRRIKSVLEVTWRRCYDVSRASWKLLEEDVTTYQERLGCCLKKMLRRIKSVLEVTWRRCCDISRASWMFTWKKMLRRIKSVLEVTWRRCCDVSRAS